MTTSACSGRQASFAPEHDRAAVKELKLSYYMGKPHYLLYIPNIVT